MAAVKDTYHAWTEGAYAYVRDQLRANATVGLGKTAENVKGVEVGTPNLADIAANPDALPVIWIEPGGDRVSRQGSVLQHQIRVTVHTFSTGPLHPTSAFADAQKRHRELTGRVYNEADHLHAAGYAAGHWSDWEPNGEIVPEAAGVGQDRAVFHSSIPFLLTMDRVRLEGV